MQFEGRFRIGRKETRQGKTGTYNKVQIQTFGATFSMMLPESLVPDAVEGKEATITFEMLPGKFLVPEVRIIMIKP